MTFVYCEHATQEKLNWIKHTNMLLYTCYNNTVLLKHIN
uniref:Uncharacterized protein n=1 Tax=Ciona intestinalis TaxID=7719 RepID=H2XMA2_CIOIN